jgi:hypothetical protein
LGFASQEGVVLDAKDLKRKNPIIWIAKKEQWDIAHRSILSLTESQSGTPPLKTRLECQLFTDRVSL